LPYLFFINSLNNLGSETLAIRTFCNIISIGQSTTKRAAKWIYWKKWCTRTASKFYPLCASTAYLLPLSPKSVAIAGRRSPLLKSLLNEITDMCWPSHHIKLQKCVHHHLLMTATRCLRSSPGEQQPRTQDYVGIGPSHSLQVAPQHLQRSHTHIKALKLCMNDHWKQHPDINNFRITSIHYQPWPKPLEP
jgi:hypothetical protein